MDPTKKFSPNNFYYKMSEGLSARGADDLAIDLDNPLAPQMIKAVKALKRLKLNIDKPTSVWFDKDFNPIDSRKAAKDALKRAVLRLDYDPRLKATFSTKNTQIN